MSPNMSTPPSARRRTRTSCRCCSTARSTRCSARPPNDPRLKPLFRDPAAEAARMVSRAAGGAGQSSRGRDRGSLAKSRPDVVAGSLSICSSGARRRRAPPATPDFVPFGIEANRKPLELIVDYAFQQGLIPRRYRGRRAVRRDDARTELMADPEAVAGRARRLRRGRPDPCRGSAQAGHQGRAPMTSSSAASRPAPLREHAAKIGVALAGVACRAGREVRFHHLRGHREPGRAGREGLRGARSSRAPGFSISIRPRPAPSSARPR